MQRQTPITDSTNRSLSLSDAANHNPQVFSYSLLNNTFSALRPMSAALALDVQNLLMSGAGRTQETLKVNWSLTKVAQVIRLLTLRDLPSQPCEWQQHRDVMEAWLNLGRELMRREERSTPTS